MNRLVLELDVDTGSFDAALEELMAEHSATDCWEQAESTLEDLGNFAESHRWADKVHALLASAVENGDAAETIAALERAAYDLMYDAPEVARSAERSLAAMRKQLQGLNTGL